MTINPLTFATIASAFAACISAGPAFLSARSSRASLHATRDNALRQQILAYLKQYMDFLDRELHEDDKKYNEQCPHRQQRRQIVAGMLVEVIDLMIINKDSRVDNWTDYLKNFSGPLNDTNGFELETYAADARTRKRIAALRQRS